MRELKLYKEPVMEITEVEEESIDTIIASQGSGPEYDFGTDFPGWSSVN